MKLRRRRACASGVHRFEELGVVLDIAQLVEQEVDGIHPAHRVDPAQHVHLLQQTKNPGQWPGFRSFGSKPIRSVARHQRGSPVEAIVQTDFELMDLLLDTDCPAEIPKFIVASQSDVVAVEI